MSTQTVWIAHANNGETCAFGVESAAKAWAKSGTVECVEIRSADLKIVAPDDCELDMLDQRITALELERDHLSRELDQYVAAARRLSIERAEYRRSVDQLKMRNENLRKALEFFANPEVYKPHPHGVAFDRPDLSWRARAALVIERKKDDG